MMPQRAPPKYGEGRSTLQGVRPSIIGWEASDNKFVTTGNRRCEATAFGVIVADLLAGLHRRVVS